MPKLKVSFVLMIFLVLMACSEDNKEEIITVNGTFTHEIPNCDNSLNPEMNCIEFIEFVDETSVNALIGGGDIVYQTDYTQTVNTIELEQGNGFTLDVSFDIQNDSTLKRLEDDSIWIKS